jgi:hypothetical protein
VASAACTVGPGWVLALIEVGLAPAVQASRWHSASPEDEPNVNSTRLYLMQRLASKAKLPLIMSQRVIEETETILRTAELTLREIRERRQRTKLPKPITQPPATLPKQNALRT